MDAKWLRNRFARIAPLGLLAFLGSVEVGCGGSGNTLQSGHYLCTTSADCNFGWSCLPSAADPSKLVCTAPTGDDGGRTGDDGGVAGNDMSSDNNDGSQAGRACTPSTSECTDGTHFATCNADGTAYGTPTACSGTQKCNAGACADAGLITAQFEISSIQHAGESISDSADVVAFFYDQATALTPPPSGTWWDDTCHPITSGSGSGSGASLGTPFDPGDLTATGFLDGAHDLAWNPGVDRWAEISPSAVPVGTVQITGNGGPFGIGAIDVAVALPAWPELSAPTMGAMVPRSQPLNVTWTSSSGSGGVSVLLVNLDPNNTPNGYYCNTADDGSFTVPSSVLSGFAAGAQVAVWLDRSVYTTITIPGVDQAQTYAHHVHEVPVQLQ